MGIHCEGRGKQFSIFFFGEQCFVLADLERSGNTFHMVSRCRFGHARVNSFGFSSHARVNGFGFRLRLINFGFRLNHNSVGFGL